MTGHLQKYKFSSLTGSVSVVESRVSFGFNNGAKALICLEQMYRESSREEGKLGLALEMIWKSGLQKEQLGFRGCVSLYSEHLYSSV